MYKSWKIYVIAYLLISLQTNLFSQVIWKDIDSQFTHDLKVETLPYRKELKRYLENNTTEVRVFSLGQIKKCKFCVPKKSDFFKVQNYNEYVNILKSTKFDREKDKKILEKLFDSFDSRTDRGHYVSPEAIVYGISFYSGEEKIYCSTINFFYLTMDLIVPGDYTLGTPLLLSEDIRKEIYLRLPWQEGQSEIMKDKRILNRWKGQKD